MATDFAILLALHFFGDFFIQPTAWALNKSKAFKPLLFHCIQYTIPIAIALYILGYSLWWAAWIFSMHMIVDTRKPLIWFNKLRGEPNVPFWLLVVQDQLVHIATITTIFL